MKPPRPEILDKPFTTKEEYLTWRTAWRKHYAELSETIHLLRNLRRPPFRFWQSEEDFRKVATAFFNDQSKSLEAPTLALLEKFKYGITTCAAGDPVGTIQYYWHGYDIIKLSLRCEAKKLMEMRKNSKVEAQRQYLALKQAKEDRERALARPVEMS